MPDQDLPTNNITQFPSLVSSTTGDEEKKASAYSKRNKKKLKADPLPLIKKATVNTPGTLAYAFKLQKMENEEVYAFLQHIQDEDPRVLNLLKEYDELSEKSKASKVIWDNLCRKHEIPVGKLFGKLAEVQLRFSRSLSYNQLAKDEIKVITSLGKAAAKQKNLEHTRLFLETSGAIGNGKGGGVTLNLNQNVDNRQQTVQFGLPQLADTTSNVVKGVREANEKLLTEGSTEFIDVQLVESEDEKEKVNVSKKPAEEFTDVTSS